MEAGGAHQGPLTGRRSAATAAADLVVVGARVRTLDPARPRAAAVAVRDGVIVAVGDDGAVRALRGPRTEVVDGRGMALVPGLVDAHCHPFWGSRAARDVDLTDAADLDAALGRLRATADARPADAWVIGHGLRREWFGDGPRAAVLEPALGGRPGFLTFRDGHGALATAAALRLAGVDGRERFADASQVVRGTDGAPTGELREPSAMEAVRAHFPDLPPARRRDRYAAGLARMAASGLVGAHAMDDHPDDAGDLGALDADGRLAVRILLHVWMRPDMDDEAVADAIARASAGRGRRWRSGAAKFFLDGVVSSGTAWLLAPDARGEGRHPFWPDPARYAEVVRRCADAGLACATHAIGDAAVRHALDACAAAPPATAPGPWTARHRIEHAEITHPADVARFAAHGVTASMQPLHCAGVRPDGGDEWSRRLGPARAAGGWPVRTLAEAGAVVALGSDWPVSPAGPLLGMAWARLRRAPGSDDPPFGPGQALDAEAALQGYTTGPAWAAGEERVAGRIAPGMRADLTGLGADPVETPADDLPHVPVLLTVCGGDVTHRAGV